jgi:adenosylcobyric acid synthase
VETILQAPKTTTRTRFRWNGAEGFGYEIHMGRTERSAGDPLFEVVEQNGVSVSDSDGAAAREGRVLGAYIHGLFDAPEITRRWLAGIGLGHLDVADIYGPLARDREYDRLADHFRKHVDVDAILAAGGIPRREPGDSRE